jgi:hypothetical protein
MKKEILNLGEVLNKEEQKMIHGGIGNNDQCSFTFKVYLGGFITIDLTLAIKNFTEADQVCGRFISNAAEGATCSYTCSFAEQLA